ncbi:craniofacial development protein 2-like [Cydia splendana]|uniref:craniofacial development protein 2-like n=1 Tax=Cydia splendana TaxID=1100963 RepID=UPI00300DAE24
MKKSQKESSINTRASPLSDGIKNMEAGNTRASPKSDGRGTEPTSQNHKLRIASWNVGSMTGRSAELGEALRRRRINLCCIQETKWKGSKARQIGNEYKLIYHGTDPKNGVGIVVDKNFQERIVEVNRISDRLMSIKFALDGQPCMNVISAYAPQVGRPSDEKQTFWDDMYDLLQSIPRDESIYIGADLNGHVGSTTNSYHRIHGNQGYGTLNPEGEAILQFASTYDLAIVNTFFTKSEQHLVTYKSGGNNTQIE